MNSCLLIVAYAVGFNGYSVSMLITHYHNIREL